ncbi:MAG: hypothetical protein WDW36_006654 [Sanguina aurantia]
MEGSVPVAGGGEAGKIASKRRRVAPAEKEKNARIKRGPGIEVKKIQDKKLKGKVKYTERVFLEAQQKTIKINDWLLPTEGGLLEADGVERTWNYQQVDIVKNVDVGVARKAFDLTLNELGPYSVDFSHSGKYLAMAGEKGHLAVLDWQQSRLISEVQVAETTRDVKFLHNEMFFAAAQKKYVYIYDKRGIEIHCMRDHMEVNRLEYLPHHFLLASVGSTGVLRYQDTSTGHIVAQHKTKLGPCSVLRQNPHNAMMCLGHARGTVTMWSPNLTTAAVKMLCHRGPLTALAVDSAGTHMATAGADGQIKVWDVRLLKPMHSYFAHSTVTSLEISQRGLLAVGYGRRVQVWQDALRTKAQSPYMNHQLAGVLRDFSFCPYEDVLAVGHSQGLTSMLVPGAGEPNFDSFVSNPYQSKKERQEQEVVQLLDKLQPATIVLNPDIIGRVRKEPVEVQKEKQAEADAANRQVVDEQRQVNDAKVKMKGKNRPSKRHRKKQTNIIEERKAGVKERIKQEEVDKKKEAADAERAKAVENVPSALLRFYKK